MAAESTISKIKKTVRISHSVLDGDIGDEIDACLADLKMVGIKEPNEADPLILKAIKLWARAVYTDDTAKAESYMSRYNEMKASLMMASGYGGVANE